jgi:hypothetical protein
LGKSTLTILKKSERERGGDGGASFEVHTEVEGRRLWKG